MKKDYDEVIYTNPEWIQGSPDLDSVTLKGHNLDDKKAYEKIKEIFDDLYEEQFESVIIISKKEIYFSCSRFFEGQDAKDEGFTSWVNTHDEYKKGLGKCTEYLVELKLKEVD